MSGWFATSRSIFEHPIFKGNAARIGVWTWIVGTAAWKDTRQDANGKTITVKRGQLLTSYRQMSKATGVPIQQLRTLVARLQKEHAVNTDTNTGRLLITICNYEKYQASQHTTNTASTHDQHTKEQDNNKTKDSLAADAAPKPARKQAPKPEQFQEFWDAYPHRQGRKEKRAAAEARYAKAFASGVSEETLLRAAIAYAATGDVKRGYGRAALTWLNQRGWEDETGDAAPVAHETASERWHKLTPHEQTMELLI